MDSPAPCTRNTALKPQLHHTSYFSCYFCFCFCSSEISEIFAISCQICEFFLSAPRKRIYSGLIFRRRFVYGLSLFGATKHTEAGAHHWTSDRTFWILICGARVNLSQMYKSMKLTAEKIADMRYKSAFSKQNGEQMWCEKAF